MNYLWAFLIGGVLCAVGQLLIDLTKLTPARILTGYVVAGVVLSAVGLYAPLAEFAGAGASVPLLGFGHLLAKGVRTAVAEKGAIGILTGGLTAASAAVSYTHLDVYKRQAEGRSGEPAPPPWWWKRHPAQSCRRICPCQRQGHRWRGPSR